jgi:hypothetical protein
MHLTNSRDLRRPTDSRKRMRNCWGSRMLRATNSRRNYSKGTRMRKETVKERTTTMDSTMLMVKGKQTRKNLGTERQTD